MSHRRKVLRKLAREERRYDREQRMLKKDVSSDRAVMEEVFDKSTLMILYNFLNRGVIFEVHGVVKAGKEARVYWAKNKAGEDFALKIYLTVSSEFRKGIFKYIAGDPRFKGVKRDTRSLVFAWALKEFKNLKQAVTAKVRVPKPIAVKKNVLIMEFIGKNGVSAPSMKEIPPRKPEKTYKNLILQSRYLYRKAKLVHGDLSEYNVMVWRNRPVLFDLSQAVPLAHPLADSLLHRDLNNLNRYFSSLGVETLSIEECYKEVTGHDFR